MDAVSVTPSLTALHSQQAQAFSQLQSSRTASAEEVAADFESIFVSQLLKEMRNTLQEGLFSGEGSDTYGGLFDLYLGRHLSQAGGFGLKESLLKSLNVAEGANEVTTQT